MKLILENWRKFVKEASSTPATPAPLGTPPTAADWLSKWRQSASEPAPPPEPPPAPPTEPESKQLYTSPEQQQTRDRLYKAYESGVERQVYEKRLEREAAKGRVDIPPGVSVSDYYDKNILKRIKDHIYKTPVRVGAVDTPHGAHYLYRGGTTDFDPIDVGEIHTTPEHLSKGFDREWWDEQAFPHELAHAAQTVSPKPSQEVFAWQRKELGELFPGMNAPNRTIRPLEQYGADHHKLPGEIHTAIVLSRVPGIKGHPGRLLTADDIKILRTAVDHAKGGATYSRTSGLYFPVPKELKNLYNSDLGTALRDKEFSNQDLTDQEIADRLNRIAKAPKMPKKKITT